MFSQKFELNSTPVYKKKVKILQRSINCNFQYENFLCKYFVEKLNQNFSFMWIYVYIYNILKTILIIYLIEALTCDIN